ncbi:MAG: hypothetical protein ABW003_26850 [Microvirga sp.]
MSAHDETEYALTPDERDLQRQLRRRRSNMPGFLIAGLAALALAGGLAYMMIGRDGTRPDAPSGPATGTVSAPLPEQRSVGAPSVPARIDPPAEPSRPATPEPTQEAGPAPSAAPPQAAPEPAQTSAQTRETRAGPAPATPTPASRVNAPAPAEIAGLRKRASELIEVGDIGAARLLLERAASGNDGAALFALAETYDPAMLTQWRVRGVWPDAERARALYQRALDRGVAQAQERLAGLR